MIITLIHEPVFLESFSYLYITKCFLLSMLCLPLQDQHLMIKENLLLGHHDASKGFVQSADYGYLTVSVTFRPVSSVRKSGQLGTTCNNINFIITTFCSMRYSFVSF